MGSHAFAVQLIVVNVPLDWHSTVPPVSDVVPNVFGPVCPGSQVTVKMSPVTPVSGFSVSRSEFGMVAELHDDATHVGYAGHTPSYPHVIVSDTPSASSYPVAQEN